MSVGIYLLVIIFINIKAFFFHFSVLYFSQVKKKQLLVFPYEILHENLMKYQIHYIPFIRGNSPRFDLAI